MRRGLHVLTIGVLAVSATGSAAALSSAQPGGVSVHVQRAPNVHANVHISFRPNDHLPQGGYYYAVIVLKPYKHYTRGSPPPCATSSNMERTDYGYPHPGRPVELALTPTKSAAGHWCAGGTYTGAIYAVPHAPPCESKYPCRSEPYERSPCWEVEGHHLVCGVVALPKRYAYPEGPPKPLAQGTRIVGRFSVAF